MQEKGGELAKLRENVRFKMYVSCRGALEDLNNTPLCMIFDYTDFIEGESDLVSGFNIEHFRGGFAFIFMAECGTIIFF